MNLCHILHPELGLNDACECDSAGRPCLESVAGGVAHVSKLYLVDLAGHDHDTWWLRP